MPSTLLTGAYAPADQERPLPVLIRVNAGFTGPNHTRVPLQACLVIGKAAADLGSQRATIQTARLSCTLPSGEVFEREISGYVAARDGLFGVPGTLVRHDAAKIGMASVTGFLSGAAQALSRAESTTIISPVSGAAFSAVTGDTTRYAAYAGLSETANQLARYYVHLANQITPAIQVPAGLEVHLVMNEGVTIDGLYADALTSAPVRYAGTCSLVAVRHVAVRRMAVTAMPWMKSMRTRAAKGSKREPRPCVTICSSKAPLAMSARTCRCVPHRM